jgi:hypothetical protein
MQKHLPGFLLILLFLLRAGLTAHGQTMDNRGNSVFAKEITGCEPTDVLELIWHKPVLNENEEKWFNLLVIPFMGYTPATRLQMGVGACWSLRTSLGNNTRLSAGNLQAYYTLEEQLVTQFTSNIYTYQNQWFLQGDWRVYIFKQPTYGLGTTKTNFIPQPEDPENSRIDQQLNGVYPMKYDWFKFHEIISRRITSDFYIGLGYHLDYHFLIKDEALHTDSGFLFITPHESYSRKNGFRSDRYISSGISANFVYDTRDNIINPYSGDYVNVNYRTNFSWLGSDQNGSKLWTEFRTYVGLSKRLPRHLLAFWTYGCFQISGKTPYLDLMSNGFDQLNSSGRGYQQGRFRGQDFVYGEAEYRFPISQCTQVLGGVVFMNITTASNRDQHIPLFGTLKPAGGIGLRVMMNKNNRTNISVDYAVGDGSKGFYFQVQEIF